MATLSIRRNFVIEGQDAEVYFGIFIYTMNLAIAKFFLIMG